MSFSLASGVASARNSSTPASAAIAAAVSGLSPVIITVLMPMRRSSVNRSLMPPFTMSLSWITPSTLSPSATTSGVAPSLAFADLVLLLGEHDDAPTLWRLVGQRRELSRVRQRGFGDTIGREEGGGLT